MINLPHPHHHLSQVERRLEVESSMELAFGIKEPLIYLILYIHSLHFIDFIDLS